MPTFVSAVSNDMNQNVETLGIVYGSQKDDFIKISNILLPHQTQTQNSCLLSDPIGNEQLSKFSTLNPKQFMIGIVHIYSTYPSQTNYLSSIDMHNLYDLLINYGITDEMQYLLCIQVYQMTHKFIVYITYHYYS